MRKLLFILICFSLFSCGKDEAKISDLNGNMTPLGEWEQICYADNPQFINSKQIVSEWGNIIVKLNQKDSCIYYVHNPKEGDIIIAKSKCEINNNFITIKGGMFSPCENFYVKEGSTISIDKLTDSTMVLKWRKEQIENYGIDKLSAPVYYTKLKRIK